MERVTITRAEIKEGQGVKGSWKKLGIQTTTHGEKWLGTFYPGAQYPNKNLTAALDAIKPGSVLDIVVETSPDGKFLNFKLPSRTDLIDERLTVVEKKVGITGETEPTHDDINPDDTPF